MQITNIKEYNQNSTEKNQISCKGSRNAIRTLSNPDSLASTIVLESFVTGGRSANAYKRGGFFELRERFTDDFVSAVFWMKGIDIFNKIGDLIGKHILKLPETDFDAGQDALRTPFKNVTAEIYEKCQDKKTAELMEKKLAVFKFTKIIASTVLAAGFIGFALPKINQALTSKLINKKSNKKTETKENTFENLINPLSIKEFNENLPNKQSNKSPVFKGLSVSSIATIAHNLENNKICKMLTSDAGILSGRVITARNPDEGREYFFRDASSSFFYFASTPLVYLLLQKLTSSTDITSLDPVAAKTLHKELTKQLINSDSKKLTTKEFTEKTIGILDNKSQEIISKLPFKSDVISLSELKKHISDENIIEKAAKMSQLQPKQAGVGEVLTKQQVCDVFKNGAINDAEFMQDIFSEKFGKNLTNPKKFIPMKKITKFRDNIDKYTQAVINKANKSNNGIIDEKLLSKMNKKSFIMTTGFRLFSIAVSAFALGFAIPKIQYLITEKKTGSKEAPGLRQYKQSS